jgi:hypothetical protein
LQQTNGRKFSKTLVTGSNPVVASQTERLLELFRTQLEGGFSLPHHCRSSARCSTLVTSSRERTADSLAEQRESRDRLVAEDEAYMAIRDLTAPPAHWGRRDLLFKQPR